MFYLFFWLYLAAPHMQSVCQIFYPLASGQPSWKLENYMADAVVIWNMPSSCNNGFITFPGSMTAADKNRFYATLLAEKTSNATMFIYYDDVPDS